MGMEVITTFRSRSVTETDMATVRNVIATHPNGSRRFISQEICRKWNWVQPNGTLKDLVCRSLLLHLESIGQIQLPPRRYLPPNPLANRKPPAKLAADQTPVQCSLHELLPICLKQVRRTPSEKLFNSLIHQYHYLGYTQPVGEHLKYIVFSNNRPLACLSWSSAPWYIASRDRFIGWSPETRQKNLHLISNNTRFLILPWIQVPHLASHVLALNRRHISQDWQGLYNHRIYLLESFVDTKKFIGTCYKADNWFYAGHTTGRGKLSKSRKPNRSKKAVYVYPLNPNFRKILNPDT